MQTPAFLQERKSSSSSMICHRSCPACVPTFHVLACMPPLSAATASPPCGLHLTNLSSTRLFLRLLRIDYRTPLAAHLGLNPVDEDIARKL